MFKHSKDEISKLAKDTGFKSETLEKVLRLIDVLKFINSNKKLKPYLVLKGGTAINFTIFNLPRLSVDIDLDFSLECSREEMLLKRKEISAILIRYMNINNYTLSSGTKNSYALDSFVFNYNNNFGNKDNLKIEINYMNRIHIFNPVISKTSIDFIENFYVLTLNKYELYGSKIKALIERCTIRDLYDVYNMIKRNIFTKAECRTIRKCTIFYIAISNLASKNFDEIINDFYKNLEVFTTNKIPQYLSFTLKQSDIFTMKEAVSTVKRFIKHVFLPLSKSEENFLILFKEKQYKPSLLFKKEEIINRIKFHPMALWKISRT